MRIHCWTVGLAMLATVGCAGGGKYGYARTYSPLGAEEDALEGVVDYDPVMAGRRPAEWQNKVVSLFGVVEERRGKGEDVDLKVSMRQLQPRNLCESLDTSSCRVTVSDQAFATLRVEVKLSPEDALGEKSVGSGSLLRVVGKLSPEVSAVDGLPVVNATYYRHWPRAHFVTTKARSYMRR